MTGPPGSPALAQQIAPFKVTGSGGFVELGTRLRSEDRKRTDTSFNAEELKFEESVQLDLDGYVYHPRFLKFGVGGRFKTIQGDDESGTLFLPGGDLRLTFLETHPYSLSLYADVAEREVERTFARTFELTSELYGVTLSGRRGRFPFQVSYDHRTRQGAGPGEDIDEVGEELSARVRYDMGGNSEGVLRYHLTDEDIQDQAIRRQELLVDNTTYLAGDKRKRFTGNVRFLEQSDLRDTQSLFAFGNIDWLHRDSFSTHYHLDFQSNEVGDQSVDTWNVTTSLRHQLYESLSTTAELLGHFEDASFGTTSRYRGRIRESYTKRLGSWGRLGINFSPYGELEQRRPVEGSALVTDEAHALHAESPVELNRRDIDVATIIVTDDQGSIVYVENEDYLVTVRGPVTEISRLATGRIADGETVLVDYSFLLAAEGDVLSVGTDVGMNLSFLDGVTLFWRLTYNDQSQISGDLDTRLESLNRHTVGVKLSRTWLSVSAEYEDYDSTFVAYNGFSESLSVFTPSRAWWRARLSGGHQYQEYTDTDEKVSRFNVTGLVGANVSTRGLVEIGADYQRQDWSGGQDPGFNDVDAFGLKTSFTWRYRKILVKLDGRLSRVDRQGQTEDRKRIVLSLRREF
ncbi:MAG: hypothetical protein ACE5E4_10960 [Candidatus Binatia bacterium]